jgi:hypothetical protein
LRTEDEKYDIGRCWVLEEKTVVKEIFRSRWENSTSVATAKEETMKYLVSIY